MFIDLENAKYASIRRVGMTDRYTLEIQSTGGVVRVSIRGAILENLAEEIERETEKEKTATVAT